MSAERAIVLMTCGLCLSTAALAAEEPVPDADFLEYLGMWQESDEDWLLLEDLQARDDTTGKDERSDPAPEGEESTEMKDES